MVAVQLKGGKYELKFNASGQLVLVDAHEGTVYATFDDGAFAFPDGTVSLPGITFDDDIDTGLYRIGANQLGVSAGGTKIGHLVSTGKMSQWFSLAITGEAGSSGVFASMANPLGVTARIVRAILVIGTQSTGASTLDIGVGADATTSNDGLIDGLSGATAGTFTPEENGGTNGNPSQAWATTGYLNVAEASGDVTALVGTLFVEVIPV